MDGERDALKQWVKQWQRTGKALGRIHREDIKRSDTERAILNLEDAFQSAIQQSGIRSSSELVEMQHWLKKSKR